MRKAICFLIGWNDWLKRSPDFKDGKKRVKANTKDGEKRAISEHKRWKEESDKRIADLEMLASPTSQNYSRKNIGPSIRLQRLGKGQRPQRMCTWRECSGRHIVDQ